MNTSYFANLKNIECPLSISLSPPKWYDGPTFPSLAPTRQLLVEYKEVCTNQVERTTTPETAAALKRTFIVMAHYIVSEWNEVEASVRNGTLAYIEREIHGPEFYIPFNYDDELMNAKAAAYMVELGIKDISELLPPDE